MALIKCSECGKEISDKATTCIHCGCPVSAMEKKEIRKVEYKKWEELIWNEKRNIILYRKANNNWWDLGRLIRNVILFSIIPITFLIFLSSSMDTIMGILFFTTIAIYMTIYGAFELSEQKNWYNYHIDELYAKGVLE